MIKFYYTLFLLILGINAATASDTLAIMKVCLAASSNANKYLPHQLDHSTVLKSSVCFNEGKNVIFQYYLKVIHDSNDIDINKLMLLKYEMLSQWCTNPDLKVLFSIVNIRYNYVDIKGKFIANIDLDHKYCD